MNRKNTSACFDTVDLPVDNIQAIQTTRFSPNALIHSEVPYDSFNLGLHVNDQPKQVLSNRAHLLEYFSENSQIQWLEQVHGNHVEVISSVQDNPIIADAVVTQSPNLVLAIMTADCLPILLTNEAGNEIGAIHGGWRSLAGSIIKNTLNAMTTQNEKILAWLGPCISVRAFEVGNEVRDVFLKISPLLANCFIASDKNKWFADLPKIAKFQLHEQNIKLVSSMNQCTFENEHRYYSYRKHNQTGRMASLICIKPDDSLRSIR